MLQKLWLCELEVQWSGRSFEARQTLLSLHAEGGHGWLAGILSRVVRLQSTMRLTLMKVLQWPCMTRVPWETWLVAS